MTKFNTVLVNKIIRLKKNGLSQRAIAKKVGISHATITNWLKKGKNNPDSEYYDFYIRWNNKKYNDQLEYINGLFIKTHNKEYNDQDEKIFIVDYIEQSEYTIIEVFRMMTYVQYRYLKIPLFYKFILEMSDDIKPTFTYQELNEIMKKYKILMKKYKIDSNFNEFIYI